MARSWNGSVRSEQLLSGPFVPYKTEDGNITEIESGNYTVVHFSLWETAFFGTWLSISMIFAIFGNLMVIAVVIRHRGMRTRTNMFLVNLAIADFLVGVLLAPFSLTTLIAKKWIFGDILCFINSFCNAAFLITSIQTLMYISIHKYLSITRPLTQLTKCKILIMIGAAWGWAIICASLTTFILSTSLYKEGTMQCGPKYPTFSTKSLIFHFIIQFSNIFLPLGLMIGCYIRMFSEIKQHMQRLDENTALDRSQILGQQRRVTITLFIVLSCFILCWIPYCVYSNYVTFERDKSKIPGYANAIAYCFGYMNSACNPVIYAWRSPSFREGYKEILCQEPSYVVSDDTLHDSSPGPLRRFSTMIHASFRGSRANSRRNSDESVHSLRMSRNSVNSPSSMSSHKLIRQLTSKTAKGSSLIRRDGSIIMIKNGKIISMRRDPSFSKMSDDVFLPSPDSGTVSLNRSHSNLSTLNKVREESVEAEPLLDRDNYPKDETHIENSSPTEKSPDKNHNLANHRANNVEKSHRKRLQRMTRIQSVSEDNIHVALSENTDSTLTSEVGIKRTDNHSHINGKIVPSSSHKRLRTNLEVPSITRTTLTKARSESNIKHHLLPTKSTCSRSSNSIIRIPYLESPAHSTDSLHNKTSNSDPDMDKKPMPKYRQRWLMTNGTKPNLKL